MFDPKQLEELSNKLGSLIAASPVRDMEKNAKAALSGLLGKLDLVTREEFDVQVQLLARTREKLDALAERVAALEQAKQPAAAAVPVPAPADSTPPLAG